MESVSNRNSDFRWPERLREHRPRTVARDRFDYISAISDSWKAQMLLNVVKLRYADAPVFLDVASVITQTGSRAQSGVSGSWWQNPCKFPLLRPQMLPPRGLYGERPTVTYSPLSGEKFARSLMTPIPPAAILSFLQAGYPVDVVLRLTVHAINGIHSRFGMAHERARPIRSFFRLSRSCATFSNPDKSACG